VIVEGKGWETERGGWSLKRLSVAVFNAEYWGVGLIHETLLFDRFLIMYNLCVFTCIIVMFVFHCTHV